MKLSDFPPERCCDILFPIVLRYRRAKERWPPFSGIKTTIQLTMDQVGAIFAITHWLPRAYDWHIASIEANKRDSSKNIIGIYPSDIDIGECEKIAGDIFRRIDRERMEVTLSEREMRAIAYAIQQMDHYAMMIKTVDSRPKRNWKR